MTAWMGVARVCACVCAHAEEADEWVYSVKNVIPNLFFKRSCPAVTLPATTPTHPVGAGARQEVKQSLPLASCLHVCVCVQGQPGPACDGSQLCQTRLLLGRQGCQPGILTA